MLGKLLIRYLKPYRWLLLGVLVFQFASALPALPAQPERGDHRQGRRQGRHRLHLGDGVVHARDLPRPDHRIDHRHLLRRRAAMSAGRDIRDDVFDKVSGFSEREVSQFGAGSLITRNTNDVQQVQMLAMMGATMLVTAPLLAIGGIIFALSEDVGPQLDHRGRRADAARRRRLIISRMVPLFRSLPERSSTRSTASCASSSPASASCARSCASPSRRSASAGRTPTSWSSAARSGRCSCCCSRSSMLVLNVTVVAVIWFGGIRGRQRRHADRHASSPSCSTSCRSSWAC